MATLRTIKTKQKRSKTKWGLNYWHNIGHLDDKFRTYRGVFEKQQWVLVHISGCDFCQMELHKVQICRRFSYRDGPHEHPSSSAVDAAPKLLYHGLRPKLKQDFDFGRPMFQAHTFKISAY